jgi:iron complex outermembrane receptor protein
LRAILILALLVVSAAGLAQFSVKGRVKSDSLEAYLPGVSVSIPDLNLLTRTDDRGHFRFSGIQKGVYSLVYQSPGYKTFVASIHVKDSLDLGIVELRTGYVQMSDVVVLGTSNVAQQKTSNEISQMSSAEMRLSGAMNLSDAMSRMPGVSQLSTGPGISKPVIRGLFGNRIQTVLYGLRFDNQQWQDEHGLGLSDVGIDRVEVIKGPASLLYGSEAMGGVINIIEEKSAPVNTVQSDFSTRLYSNTYGYATDAGVKSANEKFNWRLRAGTDSHADYSDGNGRRILNSRFGGYYGKASVGFNRRRWINQTNYMFAQNNFGFIMDPIQFKDPPDDRLSRSFDRPHHTVNLNIVSSQNIFFLRDSKIKFNAGYQYNDRQEQEGGNSISLDMILNSLIGNITWIKSFGKKFELNLGSQGFYQTNRNVGSRIIIPDATQSEISAYSYAKWYVKQITLEGGLRYDLRNIQTFATGNLNTDTLSPGKKITPFIKNYNAVNGSLGISWFNNKNFNLKSNFSSGYRPGNLAELSSNGLHEGSARYEIGNPDLKIEQNFCGDIYLNFFNDWINFSASAYHNQFLNYIYLAPTSQEYLGLNIYNYKQQDAAIRGVESSLNFQFFKSKWLGWNNSYSYVYGTTSDGKYLPFIPAPKLVSDLRLVKRMKGKITEMSIKPGVTYVFEQNRPAEFETSTPDYLLVNAVAAMTIVNRKNTINISVTGNNLGNAAYYDHLSRFKYYGVYNVGRNISLSFKINFN